MEELASSLPQLCPADAAVPAVHVRLLVTERMGNQILRSFPAQGTVLAVPAMARHLRGVQQQQPPPH